MPKVPSADDAIALAKLLARIDDKSQSPVQEDSQSEAPGGSHHGRTAPPPQARGSYPRFSSLSFRPTSQKDGFFGTDAVLISCIRLLLSPDQSTNRHRPIRTQLEG